MKDLKERLEIIQESQMDYLKGGNEEADPIGGGGCIVIVEDI